MSFIGSLFGGGKKPEKQFTPRATPATPRIGDAAGESAVRAERKRRPMAADDTILTGLGSVGAQGSSVSRSTLLGSAG